MKNKKNSDHHHTTTRMAKTGNTKCGQGCGEPERTALLWWWEYKLVQTLWETLNTKAEHMYTLQPRNSTPVYLPNRNKYTNPPKGVHDKVHRRN